MTSSTSGSLYDITQYLRRKEEKKLEKMIRFKTGTTSLNNREEILPPTRKKKKQRKTETCQSFLSRALVSVTTIHPGQKYIHTKFTPAIPPPDHRSDKPSCFPGPLVLTCLGCAARLHRPTPHPLTSHHPPPQTYIHTCTFDSSQPCNKKTSLGKKKLKKILVNDRPHHFALEFKFFFHQVGFGVLHKTLSTKALFVFCFLIKRL